MPTVFSPLVAQSGGAASAAGNVHDVSLLDIFNTARVFNVRAYGALGDGATDDQLAFTLCRQALSAVGSGTFYVPRGTYRMARQAAYTDGIFFDGISNVMIFFEPGAVLLMDNLNGSSLGDFGHGVRISGRADNIALYNVHVKWATVAAARSLGDGFRFEGWPTDAGDRIRYVELVNCWAENCPQTGGVLMGCSDVRVHNFRAEDTLGDGLHFNACRRLEIDGVVGDNVGDDALAFVTYYHATDVLLDSINGPNGPFNQPSLGQWSNAFSTATNVVANGGVANAVRISGGYTIALSNVTATGRLAAVQIDAAIANGVTVLWTYQASQGISVANVTANACAVAVYVETYNATFTDNERHWRFDVTISNVIARDCTVQSVFVHDCAGVHISGVKARNKHCQFIGLREGSVRGIYSEGTNSDIYFNGADTDPTTYALTPLSSLQLDDITCVGGTIFMQYLKGAQIGSLRIVDNSANAAVWIQRCMDLFITSIDIRMPNRSNGAGNRAVLFAPVNNVHIGMLTIEHDANTLTSLEIGGGSDATQLTRDLIIDLVVYRNTINQTDNDTVTQGGPFAPVTYKYRMLFYNGGEGSPVWRQTVVDTMAYQPDYTITNPTTNRSLDVTGATLGQLAQVVGTLLQDLIDQGSLR